MALSDSAGGTTPLPPVKTTSKSSCAASADQIGWRNDAITTSDQPQRSDIETVRAGCVEEPGKAVVYQWDCMAPGRESRFRAGEITPESDSSRSRAQIFAALSLTSRKN